MNYLIGAYLIIGAVLIFIVTPIYLKRKGFDSFRLRKSHLVWFLFPEGWGAGIFVGLLVSAVWPILVPTWVWSEFHDKK